MEDIKEIFENNINKATFNMNSLQNDLQENLKEVTEELERRKFTVKEIKNLIQGLLRTAFLIELVKDDISSTKFQVRWTNQLESDPRFASFEECVGIFNKLVKNVCELKEEELQLLKEFLNSNGATAYELPIDYIAIQQKMHSAENISWFLNSETKDLIDLRKIVFDSEINNNILGFKKIWDKIKVKTYLTDRVLTGENKTNREKRWETHPNSVHFSFKGECFKIEKLLLLQICRFKGAPSELRDELIVKKLLEDSEDFFVCPITGDELYYNDFEDSVLNKEHGKSKFQVGHLSPLKSDSLGHVASNISWISEDGNRIQGNRSLDEVEELLKRIAKNKGY